MKEFILVLGVVLILIFWIVVRGRSNLCFFNVFIKINDKAYLTTDCFYYNAENHYLNYHSPYQDKDGWCTVSNVECEIKVDRPMIYITAKTIKK